MDGDAPETVEALAVRDGKIIAAGKLAEVRKVAGKKAEAVDLKGKTLLPGFIDAHGHVSSVGQAAALAQLAPPPVGKVDSVAALQDALRRYAPPAAMPIIIGNGYDDSQLAERRRQMGTTLSGGEQQMLAIARVLAGAPRLLLIDEPTEGLAPIIVDELFALIAALAREGTPIVLVEQNVHRAIQLTTRHYLIERGQVTFEGDSRVPSERDALLARISV